MKRAVWFLLLLGAPSLHAAIRGTVFASGGAALENAHVAVYRRENALDERERLAAGRTRGALASAATDAQGTFAIDPKLQGVFDLQVTRDGYAPWRKFVLADDSDLAVELMPAPLRNGRVSAGGKAVAGAIVIVENETGAAWST